MAAELPSSEEEVQALLQSAVSSRASHIRKEAETITMANVRRLLESDLGLEKSTLDVHKVFIRQLVDKVLLCSENPEDKEEADVSEEAPKPKKKSLGKKAREGKISPDQREMDSEDLQENDNVEAPKKKKQKKEKAKKEKSLSEEDADGGGSHTELSEEGVDVEAPKEKSQKSKPKKDKEIKEVVEDVGGSRSEMSEEDSDVSERRPKKASSKTPIVKSVQNRKVEHLKKVIKACGLTIPPQIYKRVKQQLEEKQDKSLIKELEEFLSRNGLSSDPSEKEIKAAKRKIAREKDMEGIDTTNIILEPRGRRATSQLFAPVYNPPPVEYDSGSEQDDDGEEDDEEESDDAAGGGSDAAAGGSDDEEKDTAAANDSDDSE